MGAHRSTDPDDPLHSTSDWWRSQHPPDEAPTARYHLPPDRPVGMPEDRYDEWLSGDFPRPTPQQVDAARERLGWNERTEIRSEGMPTIDRPRSPAPVGAARVPQPLPPSARPQPRRRKPSLVVRVMDQFGDGVSKFLLRLAALLLVAVFVGWAVDTDRQVDRLSQENRDLRGVQIQQQERLGAAEETVRSANEKAAETKESNDRLQRRVTQLEGDDQTSGS